MIESYIFDSGFDTREGCGNGHYWVMTRENLSYPCSFDGWRDGKCSEEENNEEDKYFFTENGKITHMYGYGDGCS